MKKFYLIAMLCCLFQTYLANAQSFTVAGCSGTLGSNSYGPMYSTATANSTSRTAVIYPSTQLSGITDQVLTSVYFSRFTDLVTMTGPASFKVYVKDTSATEFAAGALDWATALTGAVLVFDGDPSSIVGTTSGWKQFPFLTNYFHAAAKNLAVFMEYTNPNASSAITWTYEYTAPCISTTNSNTTRYSFNTTGTLPTSLATTNYRRPYIGFDIFATCNAPSNVTTANATGNSIDVSWAASTSTPADGYQYYLSTTATAPTAGTTPTGSVGAGITTANLTGLSGSTKYYIWVRANCNAGDQSVWTPGGSFFVLPANDECASAISLTQSASCVNIAGTTAGATQSMAATPCTGTPDDDVWFSFVATQTDAQVTISSIVAATGTSTTTYFQVLSGTCGALTSKRCNTSASGLVGGLTVGETYFIRVYTSGSTSTINFNICVTELAAAPTTCSSLTAPTANATVSGTPTLTWGTSTNATGYHIYLDGNNPPNHFETVYNATTYTVPQPGLAPGDYYWYVVPFNSVGEVAGCETNARLFSVVIPPANDDCSTAQNLAASTNNTCTPTAGTTVGATQSIETNPTCSATGTNDDVWYSFTATSTKHSVSLSGTSNTTAVAIYSGTCGALVQIDCGTTSADAAGLTIGSVYFVRVYTTSAVSTTTTAFNICVTTPPVNDECGGALNMPLTTNGSTCNYTAVNTGGATQSTTTGQPNSCSTTAIDDDVWYTFTTPVSGVYTFSYANLTAITGTATAIGMNLYTGNCGALIEEASACSSTFGSGGSGSRSVTLTGGITYKMRLYVASSVNSGSFDFCITQPIPAPANDNCAGAIALPTPSSTNVCSSSLSGTTSGATQSTDPAPACSATGINDDVWYTFVATATTHTVVLSNASTTTALAIYSGSCGSLTEIACNSTAATATGLTIGNTYYVRVYSTSTTNTLFSDFNICVISAPANDDCSGAIALPTPSNTNSCTNAVAGNTAGASASGAPAPSPSCSATGANDDVWYSFVASATSHAVLISGSTSTMAVAVYSGNCGALTEVGCVSGTTSGTSAVMNGLNVGETYYVRTYTTSSTSTTATFNICVIALAANDDCANAQAVTVSNSNACSSPVSGTTAGATPSIETAPTCSATGTNDDVWYNFVATATTHTFTLSNTNSTTAIAVYSGSCGSLVQVGCASTNLVQAGFTIGETYFVRVYTTASTGGIYSSFDLCIGVAPSNDNCSGAQSLVATTDGSCNPTAGSTAGATASTETAPTCSATGVNDDVWYSFTATANTHTVILSEVSSTSAVAVYSGACGSLSQVGCGTTQTTLSGLTIGANYFVRVYTTVSTATTYSTFKICVAGTPTNDACGTAQSLANGVAAEGSTIGASQSMPPDACTGTPSASAVDVWYSFVPTQSGNAIVTVNNVSADLDAVVQVYSGTCGALTSIGCADGPGTGGSESVTLNNLIAGNTYYVKVNGFTTAQGTFQVFIADAALPVTINYFKGAKQSNGNQLEWKVTCTTSPSVSMEIERSTNGTNFETISVIKATALRCLQPFSLVDNKPAGGVNYYRLKSTDADGKVTYSQIISILNKNNGFEIVGLSPVPVRSTTTMSVLSAEASKMTVVISDLTGRRLTNTSHTLIAGSNLLTIDMSKLAAGSYFITSYLGNRIVKTIKVIKN